MDVRVAWPASISRSSSDHSAITIIWHPQTLSRCSWGGTDPARGQDIWKSMRGVACDPDWPMSVDLGKRRGPQLHPKKASTALLSEPLGEGCCFPQAGGWWPYCLGLWRAGEWEEGEPFDGGNRAGVQTCLELRVASEHLSYINQLILFLPKPLEAKKKKKSLTPWRVPVPASRGEGSGGSGRERAQRPIWSNLSSFHQREDVTDEDTIFPFTYPIHVEKHI